VHEKRGKEKKYGNVIATGLVKEGTEKKPLAPERTGNPDGTQKKRGTKKRVIRRPKGEKKKK